MASRCTSMLFEGGCCAGSERLNEFRSAAASNVVERQGLRDKLEIAVFISKILGAMILFMTALTKTAPSLVSAQVLANHRSCRVMEQRAFSVSCSFIKC